MSINKLLSKPLATVRSAFALHHALGVSAGSEVAVLASEAPRALAVKPSRSTGCKTTGPSMKTMVWEQQIVSTIDRMMVTVALVNTNPTRYHFPLPFAVPQAEQYGSKVSKTIDEESDFGTANPLTEDACVLRIAASLSVSPGKATFGEFMNSPVQHQNLPRCGHDVDCPKRSSAFRVELELAR